MILVQRVLIRWTQADRGAAAGTIRNALPRQFPAHPPSRPAAGWLQQIEMAAAEKYALRESWQALEPGRWTDGLVVRLREDRLDVTIDPHAAIACLQKPSRPNLAGTIALLPHGQRLVVRLNGAMDWRGPRTYLDYTLHVAFADSATFDLPLFREIDERVVLY